jgi:hypothetical protein
VSRFLAPLLAAACLWAGACSSSTPPSDKFVGTWTFDDGAVTPGSGCFGAQPMSLAGESLTLTKGSSSDLESTLQTMLGTCTLPLNVMGSVASLVGTPSCSFTVPVGGTPVMVTFTVTSWTINSTNGMTLTTTAAATGQGALAGNCMLAISGNASKHTGSDAGSGG